jgi:hypothetical protein
MKSYIEIAAFAVLLAVPLALVGCSPETTQKVEDKAKEEMKKAEEVGSKLGKKAEEVGTKLEKKAEEVGTEFKDATKAAVKKGEEKINAMQSKPTGEPVKPATTVQKPAIDMPALDAPTNDKQIETFKPADTATAPADIKPAIARPAATTTKPSDEAKGTLDKSH